MAFGPCFCININNGIRLVALSSIIVGVGVGSVSSWVLHRSLQARKNPTLATATDLIHQVNTFFGGTTGLYDLDVIFRIFILCSATAMVGGFIQFIMSFWLLLASIKGGRLMARVWVIVHIIVMLAIGGGFICIITNELEIHDSVRIFLIVTGADFVLLIYFCWVVSAFSRDRDTAV
jgi:hypothetical protein